MSRLCIPEESLHQHLVVLGKTGAGKSSALRHMVEHLLHKKKRVCVVDPKGDWWGLKSSEDGRGPGYPVIAFGGFKNPKASDIPINSQSGKHVAELIATGNRPCIIGFRGWMTSHMIQFWIDFAAGIFNANQGELYLVGDEFHNFAPKGKILDPQAGKCLHWSNRLLSEGRGLGIVCLLASQRPQKVHNDTLTSCETLVAMRVIHAADRQAVADWIDGCGDPKHGKEVLAHLASLPRGFAYVWSPEIGYGPEEVKFPMFTTFDSFAPPQLQKKIGSSGWADVNLEDVKSKMAAAIEEAAANDPKELRKKISDLERQMKAPAPTPRAPEVEKVVIKVVDDEQVIAMSRLAVTLSVDLGKLVDGLDAFLSALSERDIENANTRQTLSKLEYRSNRGVAGAPKVNTVRPARSKSAHAELAQINGNLKVGEKSILTICVQYPEGASREQLTVLSGYKRSSRDAYVQRLKANGYVELSGELVVATQDGVDALGDSFQPLPTGAELREYWRGRLPEGERKIFDIILENYPNFVSRDDLEDATGYKRSSRDAYIGRMAAKRIIDVSRRGEVGASPILFA